MEKFLIHLKKVVVKQSFNNFLMVSTCKMDLSETALSLWSFSLVTFRASSAGMLVGRLTTSKPNSVSKLRRYIDYNDHMKCFEFF
jgi:hypothetical protein